MARSRSSSKREQHQAGGVKPPEQPKKDPEGPMGGYIDHLHKRIGEQQDEIFRLKKAEAARHTIQIEFGEGTVLFRDGDGNIIKRTQLSSSWTNVLGILMATRGATFVKIGLSEQARFGIRTSRKTFEAENPGCLGSPFLDKTTNEPRREEV